MSQIGNEMTTIYPLVYAERQLSSQELTTITQSLEHMSHLFSQSGTQIQKRSETYQVSYDFIKSYLAETVHAFKTENLDYARSRLYGINDICTSCHTQDTHLRTLFKGKGREAFKSDYVYAEFSFLTRDYQQAEVYFDKQLRSKEHLTEYKIINPIKRLITIYTQIYNRPGDGAMQLVKYRALWDHSMETRDALNGWINGLNALEKNGASQVKNPDFKTLANYVEKYLGKIDKSTGELILPADEEVARVWLRGQLYHYLNRNPTKNEIPQILYWLARCDRSVGYSYNFTLVDMYLKDCVNNYPTHRFAQRCYSEYKDFVTSRYGGSGGEFTPPEIEDELFAMKRLLKHAK